MAFHAVIHQDRAVVYLGLEAQSQVILGRFGQLLNFNHYCFEGTVLVGRVGISELVEGYIVIDSPVPSME